MSARAKSSAKRVKGAKRAKPAKAARPRAKAKGKAAAAAKAPKAKGKATAPAAQKSANGKTGPSKTTPAAAQVKQRRPCAAQDPFGGPCQSSPRPGSAFCTIHSYLERTA